MKFASDTPMEKCSECQKMTASCYIARRSFFSRTCIFCVQLKAAREEEKRREWQGDKTAGGLVTVFVVLALTAGVLYYFDDQLGVLKALKAYINGEKAKPAAAH